MQTTMINFENKHRYFNGIYDSLHPSNDKETRMYTKPKQNFDFKFTGDSLIYSKYKDLDFNKKSMENFKSFNENQLDPNQMNMQSKISFYLSNNLVPGYNHNNFDNYKKEKRFQSPDLHTRSTYKVDKWYFMRKDELNAYYEKFFLDKEVDKMRKKNALEKEAGKGADKTKK